jgi:hypothetical protein
MLLADEFKEVVLKHLQTKYFKEREKLAELDGFMAKNSAYSYGDEDKIIKYHSAIEATRQKMDMLYKLFGEINAMKVIVE